MAPPASKKKQQPQTPPMFQHRTTEGLRPPSLSPCSECAGDSESGAASAELQAAPCEVLNLFKTELTAAVAEFKRHIKELGERVDHLERRSNVHTIALQEDQKQLTLCQQQLGQLEAKIEDLENRSGWGNLRVRGGARDGDRFAPAYEGASLGRPRDPDSPRDIILKFHHVETRDLVLQAAHTTAKDKLPHQMQLYADLAPATLQKRRMMKPVTTQLVNQGVKYKWGYPFSLQFTWKGKHQAITTPEAGLTLLDETGTISASERNSKISLRPDPDWTQAKSIK
ncbi:hypothetical protein XELAEV_18033301mg [Xenopus laevis]|uniref:Uncharacterized protein n=1 Tax=Xenopus laevis TaxID=8355 RepID=A0A974CJ27_XENLA|nr:hypothetical protein XELAEV_18033301mg [Xenopus laevis]